MSNFLHLIKSLITQDRSNVPVQSILVQAFRDRLEKKFSDFEFGSYPYILYNDNNFFKNKFIAFITLYFLITEEPICFTRDNLENFRLNLGVWLLNGQLPF